MKFFVVKQIDGFAFLEHNLIDSITELSLL
jgi:hypothetical protein